VVTEETWGPNDGGGRGNSKKRSNENPTLLGGVQWPYTSVVSNVHWKGGGAGEESSGRENDQPKRKNKTKGACARKSQLQSRHNQGKGRNRKG